MDDSVDYVENLSRQEWFFEKYDWTIGRELNGIGLPDKPRWLDIGCGLGNVLDWARSRFDAQTFGTDVSDFARKTVADRGHEIIGTTPQDLLNNSKYHGAFDVVTSYEVMEHLYEPDDFFAAVGKALKPGGKFHFTTGLPPQSDEALMAWSYVRPEVHIVFYSRQGVETLFRKHGIRSLPRKPIRPASPPAAYQLPSFETSVKSKIRDAVWNTFPTVYTNLRGMHPVGIKRNAPIQS